MLFKKKKIVQTPKMPDRNEKMYVIPYSKGFRGFKRFRLTVHGDEASEANNEKYYNKDFSNSECKFLCFTDQYNNRNAILFVDSIRMGIVFDPDQVYAIEHNFIEKIHFEPKEEVVLGNKTTVTRHRISVLVKYISQDEN